MSEAIIKVEGLGKKYIISHEGSERYTALRDIISNKAKGLMKRKEKSLPAKEEFWALKDVSFEIKQGEAVGIIGRNGAGKSTLLKILSRITEPTHGRIEINGRVASLLEVGTGFHPELTGRENIFLNGAILGMSRAEIRRNFDEIVDFSGVEKFLDTPVKRYSSGMYVRLAFAVAAHLEPEILVVDEVLAVGDAEFQKKCLGKMQDVSGRKGRTVLFVSHNMSAIKQLCGSAILLEDGTQKLFADTEVVINEYLKAEKFVTFITDFSEYRFFEEKYFKIIKFGLLDLNYERIIGTVANNLNVYVYFEFFIEQLNDNLTFGFALYSNSDDLLYWSFSKDFLKTPQIKIGINKVVAELPKHFLNEGDYKIVLMSSLHYRFWICEPQLKNPTLILSIRGGLSDSEYWIEKRPGINAPVILYNSL